MGGKKKPHITKILKLDQNHAHLLFHIACTNLKRMLFIRNQQILDALREKRLLTFSFRKISASVGSVNTNPAIFNVRQVFDDHQYKDYTYAFSSSKQVDTAASRLLMTTNAGSVVDQDNISNSTAKQQKRPNSFTDILINVRGFFLPRGYPDSVAVNYDRFATGQVISSILGTTCGVLSMQSMLFAIGVGGGSLPLAATLNWIIKDGLGQFGGILLASQVNNRFDADPKRWRMVADVSMNASSLLELLTPLAPAYFLPIASVANVGKNVSYLSASASRAAIHKSFCRHENLADITARSGSQSILGSLLGTGLGLGIAATVGQDYQSTLAAFTVCSLMSIGATYASLRGVTITTVSLERLDLLLDDYLSQQKKKQMGSTDTKSATVVSLLTPNELREREYLLGAPIMGVGPLSMSSLHIGSDMHEAVRCTEHLTALLGLFVHQEYILNAYATKNDAKNGHAEVHLLFKENCSLPGMLAGLFHAHILRHMIGQDQDQDQSQSQNQNQNQTVSQGSNLNSLMQSEKTHVDNTWLFDLVQISMQQSGEKIESKTGREENEEGLSHRFVNQLLQTNEKDKSGQDLHRAWIVDELMLEPRRARVGKIQ